MTSLGRHDSQCLPDLYENLLSDWMCDKFLRSSAVQDVLSASLLSECRHLVRRKG